MVDLLDLLIRLEYKRRTLRNRVLRRLGLPGDSYNAAAVLMLVLIFIPPVTIALPATIPILAPWIAVIALVGLFLLITIAWAPVGLLFL